ncbi:NADAR family protein [Methylobacterium sp. W2]|uniref:NADAR family protein n=1 Tax=Methylobacterium sp. W2 TaxID=2598107 RepID=UPI0029CAB72B|nr:NADAR family protein [Methylobacterium sp. W2]
MVSTIPTQDKLNMPPSRFRTYIRHEAICFRKTSEAYGGLSNMAPGFPIKINDISIRTSEALYQACRYPHMPEVQRTIISEASPMTAKMRSKPFRKDSRRDWEEVKVPIMRWCLRKKLFCNWDKFSRLLISTDNKPIVEDSSKDSYWGAIPINGNILEGENVLGRLLMEIREKINNNPDYFTTILTPQVSNFVLLGNKIEDQ